MPKTDFFQRFKRSFKKYVCPLRTHAHTLSHNAAKNISTVKSEECGLLGRKWNKDADTIAVSFPQETSAPTKRGILGKIAKVYDPLGLASPLTLEGKLLYRDACQQKKAWDAELPP